MLLQRQTNLLSARRLASGVLRFDVLCRTPWLRSCRVKLLKIGCAMMLAALAALTVAFMFDYVSEEDCNDYSLESSCTAYSDKCEWYVRWMLCSVLTWHLDDDLDRFQFFVLVLGRVQVWTVSLVLFLGFSLIGSWIDFEVDFDVDFDFFLTCASVNGMFVF